jgi:hypothetical protein
VQYLSAKPGIVALLVGWAGLLRHLVAATPRLPAIRTGDRRAARARRRRLLYETPRLGRSAPASLRGLLPSR